MTVIRDRAQSSIDAALDSLEETIRWALEAAGVKSGKVHVDVGGFVDEIPDSSNEKNTIGARRSFTL